MSLILGIETSCDETGAAIFDIAGQKIVTSALFSQIELHKQFGGVVPEVASRSQLEKIDVIVAQALTQAGISIEDIDAIAVTNRPGLVGSLLVGVSFAKALAWRLNKKIIGINHLEGHIFSAFLKQDGMVEKNIEFPFICLTASGGHTALYKVDDFGSYGLLGQTLDDAAGEAFDKIGKILGFDYPAGAKIEEAARAVNFVDFFKYPRTKARSRKEIFYSFSGLKTAVMYHLVKCGAYDLNTGPVRDNITLELQQQVSSSLLVCIADIFEASVEQAFKQHPDLKSFCFVGGVACNKYIKQRLDALCTRYGKNFFSPPPKFCTDNGGMIAFVGGYKIQQKKFDDFSLDVSPINS